MNQFKPIISHQEGQNLFPDIPTVIKGDKAATRITMKNTKPQIALTPYGASYMSPGQDYAFAGDTVAEFPTAQMGGQEDDGQAQIMQILQIYAQMKQIPIQQLIQQIQNLSEEEQQQSITAIAQEVQQVMQEQQQQQMAQQQMPLGQEEMGMVEEEMPMAMQGGRACIDCQEQFPQAQNLNWFYKAQGGEAFPQANRYPHMYADGGEAFPQAQTYLPYDRGSKPKPNFMFEYGGTTDIDQAYQIMKAGGLDIDPKKKKGGKFDQKSFKDYVMKNGGYLPKHQYDGIVGNDPYIQYTNNYYAGVDDMPAYPVQPRVKKSPLTIQDIKPIMSNNSDDFYGMPPEDEGIGYGQGYTRAERPDLYGERSFRLTPKKEGSYKDFMEGTYSASDDIPTGDVATSAASESTNWDDVYRNSRKKMRQNNRGTAVNYPGQTNFLKDIMGTTPRRSNVLGPAFGAALRAADFVSGMTTGREIFGRNGGSMPLPKHQFTTATVGQNLSQPSGSYNTWGSPTIPAAVSQDPAFQQMQDYNANATRIADQNVVSQGTDKLGDKPDSANSKRRFGFDTPFAARMVSNLEGIGNALAVINEFKEQDKIKEKMPLSSAWMPVQQSTDRGDYMTNTGMFRPDDYTYARSSPGMQSDQAFYTQTGGPLDMFEDGGIYDLDENTINMILAMGGSVEYL